MPTAIVTGSGDLIGSESVRHFIEQGYDVIGLENDMRSRFFGPTASTRMTTQRLVDRYAPRSPGWTRTSAISARSTESSPIAPSSSS